MKPLTPEIEYCRATVKSWERLRVLYNGLLLVPGGLLLWRTLWLQREFMKAAGAEAAVPYPIGPPFELVAFAFIFGLVANICYCLGPYAEFVVTALGFPITGQRTRYLAFGLGTMLSVAVIGCAWLVVEYQMVTPLIPGP